MSDISKNQCQQEREDLTENQRKIVEYLIKSGRYEEINQLANKTDLLIKKLQDEYNYLNKIDTTTHRITFSFIANS